jgi:hypothetical protein
MRTFVVILPVALALCTGCVSADFARTDPGFKKGWKPGRPLVYVDRLPERPYRSVGILELTFPANSSLTQVLEAAGQQGQIVGCDVVVERSIHPVQKESGLSGTPAFWMRAQHVPGHPPGSAQPPTFYSAPQIGKREFICGIWEEAQPTSGSTVSLP